MRLDPGAEFAGFVLEEEIGRGGMGVVYRARTGDQAVAIKVMAPELAGDAQFRARFQRESRLAAAIRHPNVVQVLRAGEDQGRLYIVMQLVDGGSLDDLIADGPVSPGYAASLIGQVARGLRAAHELGLVHRDVKPGNVLLDGDHALVTDFGLATAGDERLAGAAVTQRGEFMGSLDYVAPERIKGGSGDARADIYALGCLLYTLLTGRVPFPRDSEAARLFAHITDPPPAPSDVTPAASVYDGVVTRAMAKDPELRYATVAEFLAALSGARRPRVAGKPKRDVPVPLPPADDELDDLSLDELDELDDELLIEPEPYAPSPTYTFPPPPQPPAPAPPPPAPRRGWLSRLFVRRAPKPEPLPPAATNGASTVGRPTTDDLAETRRREAAVRLPVTEGFRYVHHPFAAQEDGLPLLGNEDVVLALVERILHSNGGAFLLTGFRGVGKTTVILNALEYLRAELGDDGVVPVFLNVARPKTTDELLFEVIRRLFEALVDGGVLERLPPDIQRQLILAYTRTSLSFTQTHGSATETMKGLGIGIPLLEALGPKLDISRKTTDSLAMEASFLAYSAADVEHDFLRIVSLFRRRGAAPDARWNGKVVVVIDELDKLTESERGRECLDELVSGLKNLLTTWGVHFVFIAGPDLHDLSLRHSHRGNSVYDSVFGWQLYVPCVWQATDQLLASVLAPGWEDQVEFASLGEYLRFKARGVPRLLLMELNSLVEWDGGRPYVTLRPADRKRIEFYAGVERVLAGFAGDGDDAQSFAVAIDEDRWRIGAYYVTDWILRTLGRTFTVDDVIRTDDDVALDPLLVLVPEKVEDLLEHLRTHEIVIRVRGHGADERHLGDVPTAQAAVYKLADDVGAKLREFARDNVQERADLLAGDDGAPVAAQPWGQARVGDVVHHGRYQLEEEIDRGGMGRVYRALDRQRGGAVAIKMLDVPELVSDEKMRARFTRKARIATELAHPNIVRTLDTFTETEGRLGLVMEFVEGTSLQQVLRQVPLDSRDAVAISRDLLDALGYLDGLGIVRLDLTPTSIMLNRELRPVIVDVGLAKREQQDAITVDGDQLIGTPAYLAPEVVRGGPVDIRADMYTVGLLLYEMLAGRQARPKGELYEVLRAANGGDIDFSALPYESPALRRLLSPDPEQRFATPADAREALAEPNLQGAGA